MNLTLRIFDLRFLPPDTEKNAYEKEVFKNDLLHTIHDVWHRLGRKTPCPYNPRLAKRKLSEEEIQQIRRIFRRHDVDFEKWLGRIRQFRYSILLFSSLCTQRRN
jgi:hypothetical protein